MKPFAKAFYNSPAWQACRAAYISQRRQIDGGMCEVCGEAPGEELHHTIFLTPQNIHDAEVALNPERLQWLCKDCHFKAHREAIVRGFEKRKNRKILTHGVWFGPDGKPEPQRVAIVWGPPGCGKSTYIRQHMDPTDLVVDLDLIRQALTMGRREGEANNLVALTIAVREGLYCIGGFDAADTTDLNAAKAVCMRPGDPNLYVRSMYWIPQTVLDQQAREGNRRERDNAPYSLWVEQGLMRTCPGNKCDKRIFLEWFRELRDREDLYVQFIGYDPWHIDDTLLREFRGPSSAQIPWCRCGRGPSPCPSL